MQENRIIKWAFIVSLVLHLVLAAATWKIPFIPDVDPAMADDRANEVELILLDPEDEAPTQEDPDQPQAFTEIPDRLAAETPPEQADFLASHDAHAADAKEGEDSAPSADEENEFPKVEIEKEQLDGAGGVAFSQTPLPDPREATGSPAEGAEGEDEDKSEADEQSGPGEWALPQETVESGGETTGEEDQTETAEDQPELEDWWGGSSPSILKEGEQPALGDRGFEFDQKAIGSVGAGVKIMDDYSLNTYQWDFAPWMTRFANQLHRHWVPPYAYMLGVIDGVTVIRISVERDGRLSSLEVIDTEGHESLHTASQAALKAFAPYAALPANFPEENLVITLGLYYPAWRR